MHCLRHYIFCAFSKAEISILGPNPIIVRAQTGRVKSAAAAATTTIMLMCMQAKELTLLAKLGTFSHHITPVTATTATQLSWLNHVRTYDADSLSSR